jgi:hypothetical protein
VLFAATEVATPLAVYGDEDDFDDDDDEVVDPRAAVEGKVTVYAGLDDEEVDFDDTDDEDDDDDEEDDEDDDEEDERG